MKNINQKVVVSYSAVLKTLNAAVFEDDRGYSGKLGELVHEISKLVAEKNQDYGDAWQSFGIFTPLIRINDKLLRVRTLSGNTALVADEKIEDTLKDIIGYATLALMWLRLNGPVSLNDALPVYLTKVGDDVMRELDNEFAENEMTGNSFRECCSDTPDPRDIADAILHENDD